MNLKRGGFGVGPAIAIGFPVALLSYAGPYLWNGGVWEGRILRISDGWLYAGIAGAGFVLAGIGLNGLYKRLQIDATPLIPTVWVGAALGLYGTFDIYFSGEYFGSHAVPVAFVLLTLGLASMGRVALRSGTFGHLSFIPFAVAASGGLWFLVLLVGTGEHKELMRTSTLLVHVALWVIFGVVFWLTSRATSSRSTIKGTASRSMSR